MAAIDKIYLNKFEQYEAFKNWCKEQPPILDKYGKPGYLTWYLYDWDKELFTQSRPVFMAPIYIDAYIIRNCPFEFVQKAIRINYGYHEQEFFDDAYETVMARGGKKDEPGKFYWWLSKEDFTFVDGKPTLPDDSSYTKIKYGFEYTSPKYEKEYEIGKHFKCIKHPLHYYNRPYKSKVWFINIDVPEEFPDMWYHEDTKTWDFTGEYVIGGWSSNTAHCKTIKSLKRYLLKWKLPVGTKVRLTGRYFSDNYEFVIKK